MTFATLLDAAGMSLVTLAILALAHVVGLAWRRPRDRR